MAQVNGGAVPPDRDRPLRPSLLFVGAFPPPGSTLFGGNVSDCRTLLSSSFSERFRLLLLDSAEDTGIQTPWKRLVRAARRASKFLRLVHSERPDAILLFASWGMSFTEKSLYVAYARALGIPSLLSVRSGHFIDQVQRSAVFRTIARILVRGPARLLCQGRRWQDFFETQFGLAEKRCPVVDAWVASEDLLQVGRERSSAPREPVTLLFLGALERFKGIFELLEAVARMRSDAAVAEFALVIGGVGSAEAEARRRVAECGLASVVRFAGLLNGPEKLEAFRSADVFVLPSHTEGLPNAMIEAMAAGLAVVITPVGSVPDVITHEQTGVLVPPLDPAALERELRRLVSIADLRTRLGREAHRVAAARFTTEGAAQRIEDLVREIILEFHHGNRPAA